jgi:hypothetical protein
MKIRPAVFPLAFFVLIGFSSCVREYTCQCVIKYSGQPGLPDSVIKEYSIRDTKKKAKSLCQGNSTAPVTNGGITTEEVCDLF